MAESLGDGEHTNLQAEKHRAHASDGGFPEKVPESRQPRGDVAGVSAGGKGKAGVGGVPSKLGRGCLLFPLLLSPPLLLPRFPYPHPRLLPPGVAPSTRPPGHFSGASWYQPSLLMLGGGVGRLFLAPQFTFYLHTSSLCLPTLGSLTICPQFSPIFLLELCGSFYSIVATLPVSWLASKLCQHDHTGTTLVTSVHTASGSAHSR